MVCGWCATCGNLRGSWHVLLWLQLSNAAQLLGGAYHVSNLEDAAAVGPALKALVGSGLPQPLGPTLASPRIKGSQQVHLLTPGHSPCDHHVQSPVAAYRSSPHGTTSKRVTTVATAWLLITHSGFSCHDDDLGMTARAPSGQQHSYQCQVRDTGLYHSV